MNSCLEIFPSWSASILSKQRSMISVAEIFLSLLASTLEIISCGKGSEIVAYCKHVPTYSESDIGSYFSKTNLCHLTKRVHHARHFSSPPLILFHHCWCHNNQKSMKNDPYYTTVDSFCGNFTFLSFCSFVNPWFPTHHTTKYSSKSMSPSWLES